jgi:hypothetical protein
MTKNTKIAIGVVSIGVVAYYLWEKSKKDASNDAAKAAALKSGLTTAAFTAQGNKFFGVHGQSHNDMGLSHIPGTQITQSEHRILSEPNTFKSNRKVIKEPLNAYGGVKHKNNNSPMFNLAINKAW